LAHREQVAVIEPEAGERRRALMVHHHRDAQCLAQLLRGRKMIGMGMGIDDVMDAHARLGGQREIMVDLTDFGIDQRGNARIRAADEIGLASARGDLLENHGPLLGSRHAPPSRYALRGLIDNRPMASSNRNRFCAVSIERRTIAAGRATAMLGIAILRGNFNRFVRGQANHVDG
jgi:hypothetical protein